MLEVPNNLKLGLFCSMVICGVKAPFLQLLSCTIWVSRLIVKSYFSFSNFSNSMFRLYLNEQFSLVPECFTFNERQYH
ncbi:hypothetical protein VNO77_43585 [Canavalia gladiata]|uniref:Uncharacterized protein n=1 Tax=Canavalia gladiata TaxID=3824 RepID=A0AAN9PPJ7_CANGL